MSNPTDFPDPVQFASGGRVKAVLEPIVKASIIVPESAWCFIQSKVWVTPLTFFPARSFSRPLRLVAVGFRNADASRLRPCRLCPAFRVLCSTGVVARGEQSTSVR